MPFADSDGTSLYYERHGSGPVILFVHGSGGNHAAWWQQVAALREEFTVVTMDLRGFVMSDSTMPVFDGQDFPGDVLWMGAESTCQLEPGDTVEVEISGIGTLANPVQLEGNRA